MKAGTSAVFLATAVLGAGLPALAHAQTEPDIIVDPGSVESYWTTGIRYFSADSCAVAEGCVSGTGYRTLLTFRVQTANIGQADVVLGDPSGNPDFYYDTCHHHYHLRGFGDYVLHDPATGTDTAGHKQGWCLTDSVQYLHEPWVPTNPFFVDCNYSGLTRGWSDVYPETIDCQWIDVTGLTPGGYELRATVNAGRVIEESDFSNNTTVVPVTVDDPGGTPDLVVDGPSLASGWRIETRFFQSGDPGVVEGCVGGTGYRRLLASAGEVANIVPHDLTLGEPGYSPYYVYDNAHGHWHVPHFYRLDLLDGVGRLWASNELNTFFPADDARYRSDSWVRAGFFYWHNGLQRGWATQIPGTGACQWLDVTDVPNGDYVLRARVNPNGTLPESDTSNDEASVAVMVTEPPDGIPHRPDGAQIPGRPLEIGSAAGSTGDLEIRYDNSTCPAADYDVYYSGRPPSTYQYDGGVCNIGPSGDTVIDLPDPPQGGLLWFLIVGRSGSREGGHGLDSAGRPRPLRGINAATGSYMCGITESMPRLGCAADP